MIKKALEISIRVNQDIALDPKQPAKNRIQATQVMVEAETDKFRLLSEGPDLSNINADT